MKLTENLHLIPGVTANPFLVVEQDGLTLVDAGLPHSENKILKYIAALGRGPQDLKRILITHADIDHVGALAALKVATGARTYASQVDSVFIAQGRTPREPKQTGFSLGTLLLPLVRPFFKPTPIQVDEFLSEGQVLPILGGLAVLDTSGHTPGHLSFFSASTGILFCGDSLISDGKGGLQGSREGLTWDEARARAAERKQAALGARIVCSGHGPVLMNAVGKFPV